MVRHTIACPMLNSPSVPRSEITIIGGIWIRHASEASALASVAKPLVCISTTPRMPAHPGAGDDADRLLLARGVDRGEVLVGVHAA